MPFKALETGSWLSFDAPIMRLRPMSDHLFRSEGSAITSFVRFSKTRVLGSIMLGSSPCSHRRSVSLPTGTSLPAVILALSKSPRVLPVHGVPSGASDFTSRLGVKQTIDNIGNELEAAARKPLDDTTYRFVIERAVYADRKELVPYLCLHIHDPGKWFGDTGTYPGGDAMAAIV